MEWWQWLLVLTGAILLAISISVYIVIQFLKTKLKNMFSGLGSALTKSPIPQSIELIAAPHIDLSTRPLLNENIAVARQLRFEVGGPYLVKDHPALVIMTMAKPEVSMVGTIAEAGPQKIVIDFVTQYGDGSNVTHSTLEDQGFDRPPQRPMIRRPGSSMRELYDAHLAERPTEDMQPVSLESLPALLKEFVEEDWFWRASKGGISEAELDRHLAIHRRLHPPLDDEDPKAAKTARTVLRAMIVAHARIFIEQRLRETLLRTTTLTVPEWADVESRLVFVYPHADATQLCRFFEREDDRPSDATDHSERYVSPEERAFHNGDTRDVFEELNGKLEPLKRLKKIQVVTIESKFASITADVYVTPRDANEPQVAQ